MFKKNQTEILDSNFFLPKIVNYFGNFTDGMRNCGIPCLKMNDTILPFG